MAHVEAHNRSLPAVTTDDALQQQVADYNIFNGVQRPDFLRVRELSTSPTLYYTTQREEETWFTLSATINTLEIRFIVGLGFPRPVEKLVEFAKNTCGRFGPFKEDVNLDRAEQPESTASRITAILKNNTRIENDLEVDASCITQTAQAIISGVIHSGDMSVLPVLADALDDGGCVNEHALCHLRSGGPFSKGDFLLRHLAGQPPPALASSEIIVARRSWRNRFS